MIISSKFAKYNSKYIFIAEYPHTHINEYFYLKVGIFITQSTLYCKLCSNIFKKYMENLHVPGTCKLLSKLRTITSSNLTGCHTSKEKIIHMFIIFQHTTSNFHFLILKPKIFYHDDEICIRCFTAFVGNPFLCL